MNNGIGKKFFVTTGQNSYHFLITLKRRIVVEQLKRVATASILDQMVKQKASILYVTIGGESAHAPKLSEETKN